MTLTAFPLLTLGWVDVIYHQLGGKMILRPLEAPSGADQQVWTLRGTKDGWHEVRFTEGTVLDRQAVAGLADELRARQQNGAILVLVIVNGIVDVCPDVAAELTQARPSTRVALLGSSQMDQVLSGFILSDLAEPKIARYVDSMDAARDFLTGK